MERRRATWASIAVVLLAACSGGGDGGARGDGDATVPESDGTTVTADGIFTERDAATDAATGNAAGSAPAPTDDGRPHGSVVEGVVQGVVESLPAVAETGVPGIESDDDFCRAWSTYAGSVQAISFAWATQAPDDAARLEVAATAALVQAVDAMASDLPDEIESNRQALTVDVPGPFLRRAERARVLLDAADVDGDQIDALGRAWISAITRQGIESDALDIDVPTAVAGALDAASQSFADELPSVLEDPTLDTTEFDIGPSLAYITANCPDRGTLAGNDVVDLDS